MRKIFTAVPLIMLLVAGCGKKDNGGEGFPSDFNTKGDQYRVAYMMERVSPDSVARFICNAALGKVEGARIDSLSLATLYAYENYKDSALIQFSDAYIQFESAQSLPDKMRLYVMAGDHDPQGLGYELGLEYVSNIREDKKTIAEVENEIREFKKACGADTTTYRRFLIGFKTVLDLDRDKDLEKGIYNHFINFE